MKMVLASGNDNKLKEFQALLKPYAFEIISQKQLNIADIEETGLSFVENAILKARHASKLSGLPALADDSGLEVPVLNGEPGIYSARYAGEEGNSKANIDKLLKKVNSIPDAKRTAYFYCVLVLMQYPTDPTPLICEGRWKGIIASELRGNNGFGYDPIFFDPTLKMTAAEMPPDVKNKMSHRGKALKQLLASLSLQEELE